MLFIQRVLPDKRGQFIGDPQLLEIIMDGCAQVLWKGYDVGSLIGLLPTIKAHDLFVLVVIVSEVQPDDPKLNLSRSTSSSLKK